MTIPLFPHLPFARDETPMSCATRMAAFHTGGRLVPFLNDLGIPLVDLAGGVKGSIEKLCELGGADPDRVGRNVVRRGGARRSGLRGEAFSAEFLSGSPTAFCPACLAEDDASGGDPAVARRGRLTWLLRAVRTCPAHGLPLTLRPKTQWDDTTHELAVRVPERAGELRRLIDEREPRSCSPLQTYVIDRLEGVPGPAWLDGQSIEQAMRATEMLGVVVAFGPKPNLQKFTPDDWDRAGRAGFAFTSRGEAGTREALAGVQCDFEIARGVSGPQQHFGRLYQWLEFARSDKDAGPIKAILREHIVETYEVAAGKAVLGDVLHHRRRHSVASLARESGVHYKTLRNALASRGMVPARDEQTGLPSTFDAEEGERIAAALARAVPSLHLPKALNSTRAQAEQLVDAGILVPLDQAAAGSRMRAGCAIDQAEIDAFLSALRDRAREVDLAPAGLFGIPKAAGKLATGSAKIVRLILDGRLNRTCRLADVPGYAGILVDPEEVRPLVEQPVDWISLHQAFGDLRVTHRTGKALVADRPGGAFLRTTNVSNAKVAGSHPRVKLADLAAFRATYATHGDLCRDHGLHHTEVTRKLKAAGVEAVASPEQIGTRLYSRRDLAGSTL